MRTTDPPRPPSPPSGPPRGVYGSRRKEAEPEPPCPPRTTMRAESTKCRLSALVVLLYGHPAAVLAHALVLDGAWDQREQRVVAADTHALAGGAPAAPLPDDALAALHEPPAANLAAHHV